MEKIEKIENIISDDNVEKTIMTIDDGNKITQAEIYLAYIDGETGKRYVVYTTDLDRTENEKGTFNLAVMRLEQNGYVLEGTSNEDHQNIEVKTLNVVGLSNGKTLDEVKLELQNQLPNISMIDLAALKNNVDHMTVSTEKPPRKANMPMAIANIIKRYYLFELSMELRKIHRSSQMAEEEIDASYDKLDKIDNKLDDLRNVYNGYPDNDKYNSKVNESLDQIEKAKNDIMEAKRSLDYKSIQNSENDNYEEGIDLVPELPQYDEQDEIQDKNQLLNETSEENQKEAELEEQQPSVEPSIEPQIESQVEHPVDLSNEINNNSENIEIMEKFAQSYDGFSKGQIDDKKQQVVDEAVNKFGYSVESIVSQITTGISALYEEKIQEQAKENIRLQSQIDFSENEKKDILEMVENVKNKAFEASQQAKNSKEEINNLTIKNNELESENNELKNTITSQKQLLDQQNSNMEALREEGKSRENNMLQEMESLRSEINRLKQYESAYNQIAGMFNSQKNSEDLSNNITK